MRERDMRQVIADFDIRKFLDEKATGIRGRPKDEPATVYTKAERAERAWRNACRNVWAHEQEDEALVSHISHPTLRRFATGDLGNARGSVLFCGESGVGKSLACAVRLRRLLRLRPSLSVSWLHAFEFCESYRRWPLGDGKPPELDSAESADLCVIDDMGREANSAPLIELVSSRYDRMKRIWTTTGLSPSEIEERYDAAHRRRLAESGGADVSVQIDLGAK